MSNKVQQLDEWHVILDRDDIDLRSQAKIDYAEEMIAKILPDIDESDLLVRQRAMQFFQPPRRDRPPPGSPLASPSRGWCLPGRSLMRRRILFLLQA
ncbi:hypothetical protein LCGC14_2424900, partial [marine sediment metagenome]